jgi:hypothetical protein
MNLQTTIIQYITPQITRTPGIPLGDFFDIDRGFLFCVHALKYYMLRFLRKRIDILAEADEFMESFGHDAYQEARFRSDKGNAELV